MGKTRCFLLGGFGGFQCGLFCVAVFIMLLPGPLAVLLPLMMGMLLFAYVATMPPVFYASLM
jgi:hypothetical protein